MANEHEDSAQAKREEAESARQRAERFDHGAAYHAAMAEEMRKAAALLPDEPSADIPEPRY